MYSPRACEKRDRLRSQISSIYPQQSTYSVYNNIISRTGNEVLKLSDLSEFCTLCSLTKEDLPIIFLPYGLRNNFVPKNCFRAFYEDELITSELMLSVPKRVSVKQAAILKCASYHIMRGSSNHVHQQWVFMMKFNPQGSHPDRLRVSSFCRMITEYRLPFTPEKFLEALFLFLGKKVEDLSFEEFVTWAMTFGDYTL